MGIFNFNVTDEYGGSVIYNSNKKSNTTLYSDRLYQEDSKKHDKLSKEIFGNSGQYWGNRTISKIRLFLQKFVGDKNLELVRIVQYENQSNGYPYWRFDVIFNKEE